MRIGLSKVHPYLVAVLAATVGCAGEPIPPATENSYVLDRATLSFSQPIAPEQGKTVGVHKVVQITVVKVENPQLHPLNFRVTYAAGEKPAIYLGSFSLYPANNPGTFIVSTRGQIIAAGLLNLHLEILDEKKNDSEPVQVVVKPLKLIDG